MNLLAGDIGGTKTLLGIYRFDKELQLLHKRKYHSKEWNSFYLLLNDFIDHLPSELSYPEYSCIGVAGPIIKGVAKVTNLDWEINEEEIKLLLKIQNLKLLNDFECLIYAIPFLNEDQYKIIQRANSLKMDNSKTQESTFSVIGAGTGLGLARGLITDNDHIKVFPSEGGHKEFSPRSEKEWDLRQWIKRDLKLQRVSIERVVSGTGLGHIARWRISKNDAKSHPIIPFLKTNEFNQFIYKDYANKICHYAQRGDALMKEVVETWISAYGSAAGDLALHELPSTGIWIGGGTAIKHLDGLCSKTFRKGFINKGRFSKYLSEMAIMALTDQDAGLFGAACKANLIAKSNGKIY